MLSSPRSWIRQHPVPAFFALAYAFSWWPMLVEPHGILPPGPLVAALVVLAAPGGRGGVQDFLGRMVRARVAPGWYALVLGLPPLITAVAIAVCALVAGGSSPARGSLPPLAELPPTFLFILLVIGFGEEPAWRGVALPGLLKGRSTLGAAGPLAGLHVLWHLPLFGLEYDFRNGVPWALSILAYTLLTAWLYFRTEGNLLLPALFHTSVNVAAKYLFFPAYKGGMGELLWWIQAGLWCLAALAVILKVGRELGRPREVEAFLILPTRGDASTNGVATRA